MKTFKIYELGCKVNQYESQLIREQLSQAGFIEGNGKPADMYIINTCTVTNSADSDSRNFIRRASQLNPKAKIVVTGCYAEKDVDEIKKICEDAIIVRNERKENIIDAINNCRGVLQYAPTHRGISNFANHNRAFVKIQDGCDNYCSYCKVPLVRGRARNRGAHEIIEEARQLVSSGFKEIVLCGICLGAYENLTGLLAGLIAINDLERVRLSSIEPVYINQGLIDFIASSEKICKHLHIPLQSGDDKILKLMNRRYTKCQYINLIKGIRGKLPEVAISTDVLVGFPGEAEDEFQNTIKTLEAVTPMRVHVFSFSKRKGTAAFSMAEEPDKKEKQRRAGIIKNFAEDRAFNYAQNFLGRKARVLVENNRDKKTGMLTGYTDTYIKVLFNGEDSLKNRIIDIKINKVLIDRITGTVI